jgi:hypothetical protein
MLWIIIGKNKQRRYDSIWLRVGKRTKAVAKINRSEL